ncbi:MAG TPA: PadR family transcriptional regulator [Ktedonobacterales bacterium]
MTNYKQLMLLGLLLERPMYGQQIREVIENHHHLFAEHIKKPTIYYQLERLAQDGYLEARQETVEAPGTGLAHETLAAREREVYHITPAGRAYFTHLLREALRSHTPQLSDLDACLFFLDQLAPAETVALLRERYERLARERANLSYHLQAAHVQDRAHRLVTEHQLALLDAELGWLARTLLDLRAEAPADGPDTPAPASAPAPPHP